MLSHSKKLMEARLGVYEKAPYQPPGVVEGIDDQSAHLLAEGGHRQQERMILAKRKTLDRALFNSYQAAEITPVGSEQQIRVLINPNVTKQDYDDKVLSVGYEYNLKPGSVFKWLANDTYWLIYLQDLTELAYFRGEIRRCDYQAKWKDENGNICNSWMAIRGPVETKINFLQKNGISLETPNYSLHILMPKTEETVKYFKRYNKFYIGESDEFTESICWRIEAIDSVSMPGILEITAVEYYSNEQEDDVKNGIVGGLIVETLPAASDDLIVGPSSIKPKKSYTYRYKGNEDDSWKIDSTIPIDIKISDKSITLTWTKTFSGSFILSYGSSYKEIIVESLF